MKRFSIPGRTAPQLLAGGAAGGQVSLLRRSMQPCAAVGDHLHVLVRSALHAAGIMLVAVGAGAMVASSVGTGTADAFIGAIAANTGLAHGTAALVFSVGLIAIALVAKARVRPATVAGAFLIGPVINFTLQVVPQPSGLALSWGQFLIGELICGLGVAALIHANLGAGSLELICAKLSQRLGVSEALVRAGIDMSLVVVGAAAGGPVGLATAVFAVTFGPVVALHMNGLGAVLNKVSPTQHRPAKRTRRWRFSRLP